MSTSARQLIRRRVRHLPALAGAVLLAVLIPLACILHCQLSFARQSAAVSAGHTGAHHHTAPAGAAADAGSYTPSGHDHRLCGAHAAAESLAYPQALYELVALSAPLLSVVVLALGAVSAALALRLIGPAAAPLTPPPQLTAY